MLETSQHNGNIPRILDLRGREMEIDMPQRNPQNPSQDDDNQNDNQESQEQV